MTHGQFIDTNGTTLDVTGDDTGISLDMYPGGRADLDVPFDLLPDLIAVLLSGPDDEGMKDLADRYDAMFTPPGGTQPHRPELIWLACSYLHRLLKHRDYETWAEEDRDGFDGMLLELIATAYALRPKLVDGEPDCPNLSHYAGPKASCGHPADEDGEHDCSWWPERAPLESR